MGATTTKTAIRWITGSPKAAAIFGGVLLLALLGILWIIPEPTTDQRGIIRLFMALGAAFLSSFFTGGISLEGKISGQAISAGGSFVVFVLLMFVVDPFSLRTVVADTVPAIARSDSKVEDAQESLKQLGLYTGDVDGKATTETRTAIRRFQATRSLPQTGYVDPRTARLLTQ